MSYDRQIDQLCPHLVVDEFLYPIDRMRVVPMRPIASSDSVVLRVDGVVEVPSYGVEIPASSGGTREGPFTIKLGVNDTLKLRVNNGAWQTVVVPPSVRLSSKRLADIISTQLDGIQFFADGDVIKFKTNLSGKGSTVFIHDDSTLAVALGIKVHREYRGKKTFPGWSLVNYPNTVNIRPVRMIVFDEPLAAANHFVELNYTTVREECRRCGGIGIENDWRYTNGGEVVKSAKEDLLMQELQKILYTVRGSNPFHSWYGATIIEQIGQKITAGGILQNKITSDIQTTFSRWQSIKKQQEENVGQPVSDEEFPFRLQSVTLEQSQKDPTVIFVNITVQNRSFRQIQFSRGLRLPLDLLGPDTQQEAITRVVRNSSSG
jgi:phage baseplate assembly protein W